LESEIEQFKQITPNYGIYEIKENVELLFPSIKAQIKRDHEKSFLYSRVDSEGNKVEKIIPSDQDMITIEVAPIRPLNYPARRTNFVYLDFNKEVFLSKGASTSFLVRCPIEIGIFLVHEAHKDSMDSFSCDPSRARFGLYGSPDTGILCKYFKVPIIKSELDSEPYHSCVIRLSFENLLERGFSITKVVFPITDHSIYYESQKAQLDPLQVKLRKRGVVEFAEAFEDPLENMTWAKSPSWEDDTHTPSMEMGLE